MSQTVISAMTLSPGLLGAVCGLLLIGVVLCACQLHRQRGQLRSLQQQVQQAGHSAAQLQAVEQEKTALEQRLREQAETFAQLAHEDDLSGLPNRRAFDDALVREMASARREGRQLSLAVMSIDHLKQINNTWSRAAGDLVLCEVGELLRSSLRASDMAARLGNKEFAVLLTNTSLAEAERVCQRLQRLFGQYGEWGGRSEGDIAVTFSAGVVQLGGDQAPVLFYQRAKQALAQAKQDGRARTCVA
ncbi:MAG: diguanylate cyclase domain-containing protein [Stenotrophomonas sp.]|uniref:diguanylate cyclase domain-containing protein n=1 Tax=Stenotrophomonas sp. TaxID=69392 RepID=UPI003D6CFCFC